MLLITPLLILSVQIAPLMTGFKLTCVLSPWTHSNCKLHSKYSASRWHPSCRPAYFAMLAGLPASSLPARLCLLGSLIL